jgi:hypothetical protein
MGICNLDHRAIEAGGFFVGPGRCGATFPGWAT